MDSDQEQLRPGEAIVEGALPLPDPASRSERWRRRGARLLGGVSPHSVAALDLDSEYLQLCRGLRLGSAFVPVESWRVPAQDADLRDALLADVARRVVNVSVPESLVIRRYFHLPTHDEREVGAMLGYQLGPSLPIALRDLSWCWQVQEITASGLRVLVELVRVDAVAQHMGPFVDAGVVVDRVIPEGHLFAHRVRDLTGQNEACGIFLRPEGVLLVAEREGRMLFASRLSSRAIAASDLDATHRRGTLQHLEASLERVRGEFTSHFDRPLPDVAIVVAEPARSPQDHDAEVVLSNALGAQPAGARVHDESLPWRGTALAALASESGSSLATNARLWRTRRNRVITHAALFCLGLIASLVTLGNLELRRLEDRRQDLASRQIVEDGSLADLPAMQEALREAARRRSGDYESLRVLLALQSHATSDILVDDLTYLAGERVHVTGSSQDLPSIITFVQKLEKDPVFADATIQSLQEFVRDERTRTRFAIEGRLTP